MINGLPRYRTKTGSGNASVTIFFFFASIILVSVITAILAALLVARAPLIGTLGPFSTGLLGLAACFLLACGLFYLLDPDPVAGADAPLSRLMRNLPVTGLSALIWLPVFVTLFNRLRIARVTK